MPMLRPARLYTRPSSGFACGSPCVRRLALTASCGIRKPKQCAKLALSALGGLRRSSAPTALGTCGVLHQAARARGQKSERAAPKCSGATPQTQGETNTGEEGDNCSWGSPLAAAGATDMLLTTTKSPLRGFGASWQYTTTGGHATVALQPRLRWRSLGKLPRPSVTCLQSLHQMDGRPSFRAQ